MEGNRRRRIAAALVVAAGLGIGGVDAGVARAEEAARLDPIVVTATRIEQKASEQAASVSVVTREEIEARIPAVAGDALRGIPGVDVQRSGSPGDRENIKIRGGLGAHTLVLIDGFPVNSPTLGSFDIGSLPADGFERIEVVRGAQSALYGSSAMSGVVNFIPRKGEGGREYGLGMHGGSHSTLKWNGYAQGGGRGGNLHLGVGGYESDGIFPNDDASLASFLGSGEIKAGERTRIHAILLSTDERKGLPIDFNTLTDANHRLTRRGLLSGARVETDVSRILTVTASGSLFDEFFDDKDPADAGDLFPFTVDDITKTRKATVGLEGRVTAGPRSTTFLGLEYRNDRVRDTNIAGGTSVASSTFNRSVYLQEELRPWKGTGLSAGARLDRNTLAGTEFNPKVAVFQEFGKSGTRLRGAVGRGFRVPTPSEKFDPTIGNPALSPEVVVSYEAGIDASVPGRSATLSATYFYQDYSDLIQFVSGPFGPLGFGEMRNAGRAFSRGVEAEAVFRVIPGAALAVAYTWSDTWDATNRRPILGIPSRRGTASLLLSPSPAWEGRIDWRVESDQPDLAPFAFSPERRPGYARVDAFSRYTWEVRGAEVREIALTGKIQNLLDREYEERKGIPAPGISFLLGAEVTI